MRAITFERWARRELTAINKGSFSLGRLAAKAQAPEQERLRAMLLLYAVESSRCDALFKYLWNDAVREEYAQAISTIGSRSVMKLALRGTPMRSLPEAYIDVLAEFVRAYHMMDERAAIKSTLWKESRELQLRKGISNSAIYEHLGLNPGNANAYLKHGAVEKVSVTNAHRIHEYLLAAPETF